MSSSESQPHDEARRLTREWLGGTEENVLAAVDLIGARAIRAAAEASARLDRISFKQTADAALSGLEVLAADLSTPSPKIRARFFKRPARRIRHSTDRINDLVDQLGRELDAIGLSAIALRSTGKKVKEAEAGLLVSQALIEACTTAIAAAQRELAHDRPDRADFLRDVILPRLQERNRDILTQTAITHQAMLTLQMLGDSQSALARALVRARDISIAALRTAIAAQDGVDGATVLSRQAGKMERSLDALPEGGAREREVGRDLHETLRQARREIGTAETSWSSTL